MSRDDLGLPRPARERSGLSCMVWGCLAVVLVGVLSIGSCVAFLYQGKKSLDPFAEQFFVAWDQENYTALEEQATVGGAPPVGLVERIQGLRERMGPIVEKSQRGFNVSTSNGAGVGNLTYHMRFANGEGMLHLEFVKDGERWALSGISIDSDLIPEANACPRCGHENEPGSNFCTECGQALTSDAEAETVEI